MSNETNALLARVGDVVICRDAAYRDALKLPDEFGLVLDARKDRAKVYLPQSRGEPWIPVPMLARVRQPIGDARVPPWMQRTHYLARMLDMLFMEVTHVGADGCAIRLFHGEAELDLFDELRSALGDELRYWRLLPAGMHKVESAVAFAPRDRADPPLPRPHAEG
ncbi:MAG: hypothetical protein EXS13_08415 [Planctomycetes bacterium]|nr:hypothetical protein [Planctomycetota bacterium]